MAKQDNKAKKLLEERESGQTEHYAPRPEQVGQEEKITDDQEKTSKRENNSDQKEQLISASYCNKCGAELSPNSFFCKKCGAPVQNNTSLRKR
ncbi:MAG: zinc ribbon domain-containing protein [Anaerolineaceae bacterium]|nr:zinc ribbon domain-containing protein [Anaerolineaceae bacterium]